MAFPSTLMYPGLGATAVSTEELSAQYVREMHNLANQIYAAKQRNDRVAVAALAEQFRVVADQYRALGSADMSAIDRFLIAVDQWIETSIDAIPGAIAALPRAVGSGLIQAAIPFALLYLGYIFLSRQRTR